MFLLISCCLQENLCKFLVALSFCYLGKESVLVSCLAFTGKCFKKILLSFSSGIEIADIFLFLNLFKGRGGLPAYRADEVFWKLIAFIDIAADLTFPFGHFFISLF